MTLKSRAFPLILVLLAVITFGNQIKALDKVVCYYGSWSVYREGNGKFTIQDIDTVHCTHVIYSFIGINKNGTVRIMDYWNNVEKGAFKAFTQLKSRNRKLKTLIAMGGWNEDSSTWSAVAANSDLSASLANSILNFLNTYGFDGFDFDWEYPAQRGGVPADKANFVKLVKAVRQKLGKTFLVTAAVAGTKRIADISYDLSKLAKYLDFINIMSYDYHSFSDGVTGKNAPLYPAASEKPSNELNVAAGVQAMLDNGVPANKLILGCGTYGKSYTLANPSNRGLGAPSSGPGKPGKYSKEAGILSYMEICELQKDGGWSSVWDNKQKVPYMFKDDQWVGFDNEKSFDFKISFAKSKELGGFMVWVIDMDDFRGLCGKKYPLITKLYNAI